MRSVIANSVLVAGLGIVAASLSGCPSLSTLQTPRTVPQGQIRFGLGLEAVGIKTNSTTDSSGNTTTGKTFTFPQLELSLRYGLTDNLDIGGKLYLIGAELGLKYQFLRGSLDLALAPAVSYMSLGSGTVTDSAGNSSSSSVSVTYLHLPLLMGLNINDSVAISFGPKLLYTVLSGTVSSNSDTASASVSGLWVGGYVSLPLKVGEGFWIAPELNVYRPLQESVFLYQGGLALLFGGADRPRTPAYPPVPPGYPPPPPGYAAPPPGYAPPPGDPAPAPAPPTP